MSEVRAGSIMGSVAKLAGTDHAQGDMLNRIHDELVATRAIADGTMSDVAKLVADAEAAHRAGAERWRWLRFWSKSGQQGHSRSVAVDARTEEKPEEEEMGVSDGEE